MKRLVGLLGIAVSIVTLAACGNPYDDRIDQVIKMENEELNKSGTETDLDSLNREDTEIKVYNDGAYIKIRYEIREDDTPVSWIYENKGDNWNRYGDEEDIKGLEADYTENVDDDDDS